MKTYRIYVGKNTPVNNYPALFWSPLGIERIAAENLRKYYAGIAEITQTNTRKDLLRTQLGGKDIIIRYPEGIEKSIDIKLPSKDSYISITADSVNQKKNLYGKYLGAIYLGVDGKYYEVVSPWSAVVQQQYIEMHPYRNTLRRIALNVLINNREEAFYLDNELANKYQALLDVYKNKIINLCKNKSMKECAKIVVNEMKKIYKEVYNEIPVVVIVDEQTGEEEEIWPDNEDSSVALF